jgi:hypothetical protein
MTKNVSHGVCSTALPYARPSGRSFSERVSDSIRLSPRRPQTVGYPDELLTSYISDEVAACWRTGRWVSNWYTLRRRYVAKKPVTGRCDGSNRAIGTSRLLRRTAADGTIWTWPGRGVAAGYGTGARTPARQRQQSNAGGHSGNATNSIQWCEDSWLIPRDTIRQTCGKSR